MKLNKSWFNYIFPSYDNYVKTIDNRIHKDEEYLMIFIGSLLIILFIIFIFNFLFTKTTSSIEENNLIEENNIETKITTTPTTPKLKKLIRVMEQKVKSAKQIKKSIPITLPKLLYSSPKKNYCLLI